MHSYYLWKLSQGIKGTRSCTWNNTWIGPTTWNTLFRNLVSQKVRTNITEREHSNMDKCQVTTTGTCKYKMHLCRGYHNLCNRKHGLRSTVSFSYSLPTACPVATSYYLWFNHPYDQKKVTNMMKSYLWETESLKKAKPKLYLLHCVPWWIIEPV